MLNLLKLVTIVVGRIWNKFFNLVCLCMDMKMYMPCSMYCMYLVGVTCVVNTWASLTYEPNGKCLNTN